MIWISFLGLRRLNCIAKTLLCSQNLNCDYTPDSGQYARLLNLPLDQLHLEFGDRLGRVEALRAGFGAVHDGVAAIEPERILEIVEPLAGGLVAGILDPARRLQQRRGAQEAFAVPPIARAGGRAAGAEAAFIN